MRRRVVIIVCIVLGLLLVLNVVSALLAARPALQAKIFGTGTAKPQDPGDVGLDFERVDYGRDRWGWWIPAKKSKGAVVIVHGFNLTKEPIRTPSKPIVPFAADLHVMGYSALLINAGYATGAHRYTGGEEEAKDIDLAVSWLKEQGCGRVAVWGFSAGGHDSLIAGAMNDDIAGVVSDSAFANTGEIVKQQAAIAVHLPHPFLALTPQLFSLFGARDVDVGAAWEGREKKPVLVIHGDADEAISPENATRIADSTGGEVWIVEGADHTDAYNVEKKEYRSRVRIFLRNALEDGC